MGSHGAPPPSAQRARTRAPDFAELFRSTHGSRHSSRTGAGTGSSPSSIPSPGEKTTASKPPGRRSMLPFLGRKKPEQSAVLVTPTSSKPVGTSAHPVTPANTVHRSFGNGHAVLMVAPSSNGLPTEPPLPSKLPSVEAQPSSLGSKLAAHFTPLRSPSRHTKVYNTLIQKSAPLSPPVPSPAALSPPALEGRAPSIESQHSSMRSRSTTPRPLRGPHSSAAENGDGEDFSDLFTLPDKFKQPPQFLKSPSMTSVHAYPADLSKRSGEITPVTPSLPSGPPLQFPIPPSSVAPPRLVPAERGLPRSSSELASLSSQGSRSPSKRPSPVPVDGGSTRSRCSDFSSQDERRNIQSRTISFSGSDTDASRTNDSTHSTPRFMFVPMLPKPSSMKPKLSASHTAKTSSGPPPSGPLPSPPLSPSPSSLGPRPAPIASPNRVLLPRPRANTLSVTSNLAVPGNTLPKTNQSLPPRSGRANSDVTPDGTASELREALSQQRRKNAQLQEYIDSITKRYEDDRTAMTKTIEKLERNVRKKTREIEGLRWLVIHNGAVSDIDAAANLARSSFSTQEGEVSDGLRRVSPLLASSMVSPHRNAAQSHLLASRQQAANTLATAADPSAEIRSNTSSSAVSSRVPQTSQMTPPPSANSEWKDGISRAERQKLKEERRASKALRRISAASSLPGIDPLVQSPVDVPLDPNFDPKQRIDEVLEKLHPFRHT